MYYTHVVQIFFSFISLWFYRIFSNPHFLFLHLEFLGFSAHFEQLSNGVHKALEVMVAHLLNFAVVVADPPFQFIHEESMFLSIINRPSRKNKDKIKKVSNYYIYKNMCSLYYINATYNILYYLHT